MRAGHAPPGRLPGSSTPCAKGGPFALDAVELAGLLLDRGHGGRAPEEAAIPWPPSAASGPERPRPKRRIGPDARPFGPPLRVARRRYDPGMGKRLNRTIAVAGAALVGSAVAKEMRKPAGERTWHGRIAGLPYDFRPPTPARLRAALWNPDSDALFTPHAFGVGYSVNFARLLGRHPRP